MGNFIIKGRITGWEYEQKKKDPQNWELERFYLVPDQHFTVTYADKKFAVLITPTGGTAAKQIRFKEKLIIESPLPGQLDKTGIVTLEFSKSATKNPCVIKSDDDPTANIESQLTKIVCGE